MTGSVSGAYSYQMNMASLLYAGQAAGTARLSSAGSVSPVTPVAPVTSAMNEAVSNFDEYYGPAAEYVSGSTEESTAGAGVYNRFGRLINTSGTSAQEGSQTQEGDAALKGGSSKAGDAAQTGKKPISGMAEFLTTGDTSDLSASEIKTLKRMGRIECSTCTSRKYQDGSDESNVSFKNAAHIDPGAAAGKVMSHEAEHVKNAFAKAAKSGGRVVSATVSIKYAVCPECGREYVAGGLTNTTISTPQD